MPVPENVAVRAVKAPFRAQAKLMEVSRELGQVLEDVPRVATYITARENGYSAIEAKRIVDASFVQYMTEIRRPMEDFLRARVYEGALKRYKVITPIAREKIEKAGEA